MSFELPQNSFQLNVDFQNERFIYPVGLNTNGDFVTAIVDDRKENFVVFECVHRLLKKGYKPEHIELERPVKVGHGASGGRSDIIVKDNDGNILLIIECKTYGTEFNNAWKDTLEDGGQLFTYVNGLDNSTQFVALYASELADEKIKYDCNLIALRDNEEYLQSFGKKKVPCFKEAKNTKQIYAAWAATYQKDYSTQGLFEEDIAAYTIGKTKYSAKDLKEVDNDDIQKKYHQFATILRKYNVSGHENAFDKLVNLFLAKIVDENINKDELAFYWKGAAYDDVFSLTDRLQKHYKIGMEKFLNEEVTYIENADIDHAFRLHKKDATKKVILDYLRQLKFFTNNDFAFIDVHNEKLFYQNAEVLLEIVKMIQDIKLQTNTQNQFLGDLFEGFLDKGVKQSEGQFFTPMPIVKFLISSLPLAEMVKNGEALQTIDYACGAGHFLNEYANQILPLIEKDKKADFYKAITGIEKEYRLSKVAKVSAFMYGQDDIKIIYGDALAKNADIKDGTYSILVANPPYSVKGFLETLDDDSLAKFELFDSIDDKQKKSNTTIECFFVERAKQLLKSGGVAAIILPSSILSNGSIYIRMREILLKYFDIIAIVEFGSDTFSKTGTNTATLFLRRKDNNPDLAEHFKNCVDAWFEVDFDYTSNYKIPPMEWLDRYCRKINVAVEDYKTLLKGEPNETLLNADLFKEYKKAFDTSTEYNNIQKNTKTNKEEKESKTEKAFLKYVRAIESDKLYYFLLAESQPNNVVLVKSPTDKKAIKNFLGYEFSHAKGNEGIKYLGANVADDEDSISVNKGINKIKTPLFNPNNLDDNTKINTIIRNNFIETSTQNPQSDFVSFAKLSDMLDFSRVSFDKAIKTTPEKKIEIVSKYELVKLGELVDVNKFSQLQANELADLKEGNTNEVKLLPSSKDYDWWTTEQKAGDKVCEGEIFTMGIARYANPKYHNGKFVSANNKIISLKKAEIRTSLFFVYNVALNYFQYFYKQSSQYPQFVEDKFNDFKIPIPPLNIQKQIVSECAEVDEEYNTSRMTVEEYKGKIAEEINAAFEKYESKILESICDSFEYGTSAKSLKMGNVPVIRMGNIQDGKIIMNNLVYTNDENEIKKYILHKNDVLFNRTNSPVWVGKTGFYDYDDIAIFAGYLIRINYQKDKILPLYLTHILNSEKIRNYGFSVMSKAINQANISAGVLKTYQIPVPTLAEQQKIVAEIEGYEAKIAEAQEVMSEAGEKKKAILEKFMR
ncbi:MAG: N-6 DNA methylase [Bacteroidales bacterium]|nr:N-6 DNA methylase [Bacteroidales bacterium]